MRLETYLLGDRKSRLTPEDNVDSCNYGNAQVARLDIVANVRGCRISAGWDSAKVHGSYYACPGKMHPKSYSDKVSGR